MIKTLIIEDEKAAADRLERMLTGIAEDIVILSKPQSIDETLKWLRENPMPDLIMLDIQLADGISFEIFREEQVDSFVIFTTAYDEYAIRAFELNSIDYLLKPVERDMLIRSLEKFRRMQGRNMSSELQSLMQTLENQTKTYKKRFLVYAGEKIKSIDSLEIAYFYSHKKTSFLTTRNGRHYPVEFSLDKLESMMDPEKYFRINRQFLVSIDSFEKIFILSQSRIKVELSPAYEEEIYVSNARAHDFRQWLDN